MSRVVLVATDGTEASLGALRFCWALTEGKGTEVEVLSVVEPVPVFDAGFMVALPEIELFESRQKALRQEIENQIEKVTGDPGRWPIVIGSGVPGTRIVKRAEELGADLIVLGLGRHRPMDRVFGAETALQVVRVSHVPVLAVPEGSGDLPRSAALAVDFSPFSQRAAQAALTLMATPWEAHFVHVMSGMEFLPTISEEWRTDYEKELQERLSDFATNLAESRGNQTSFHVLEGEPSQELLAFSKSRGVELLVAGSHGHSFVGRLLMGSVSTRLIRGAHVPVLVVPPPEPTEEALSEGEEKGPGMEWMMELSAFEKANAGRQMTLEVDDPETGVQECAKNLLLRGVNYDPRADRLEITLGPSGSVEGHLTHSIPKPEEVWVERGEEGRAEALHVRLSQGQVILRILWN